MTGPSLHRSRQRLTLDPRAGWLGGVCAGAARYLGTDPTYVRLATVIGALFLPKLTIAAYLLAWCVLDSDPGR